jgi:hypothetical protein
MPRGVSRARGLVAKARAAALEAVAAYNSPIATFKSGTYVVLMHVAWTALLLAIFRRQRIKPYYRKEGSNRYQRVDGRPKVWELRECVRQYWGDRGDAVSQNLRFFIGLRNLIEHADVPRLDLDIFGECQALLHNFEDLLEQQFGARYAMQDSLAISLQFSRVRHPAAEQALREGHRPIPKDISEFVKNFRSGLSPAVANDMAYSYKVFLVPMIGANRSKDALPVEFLHYDPNNPEHDRVVTLIKQKLIPGINVGVMKATQVAERVAQAIAPLRFTTNMHTLAWKHWGVRPATGASDPAACKIEYCQYDPLHKDYAYTEEWVQFLVFQLGDENIYNQVVARRNPVSLF